MGENTARPSKTERRLFVFTVACLCLASGGRAVSLSDAVTRGPEARALGMDRVSASLVFETDAREGARWRVEAGEWTLFEISGLAAGTVSTEARRGRWGGILSAGVLESPVGRESAVSAAFLAAGDGRVRLAGEALLESVALDGCRSEHSLSFAVAASARISSRLVLCSRVGGVRAAGAPLPGADASLRLAAFPAGGFSAVVGIAVARDGTLSCGVGSRVRLSRRVSAALGYDDAAAAITGSLTVGIRSLALEAGASAHPVLGVSKAFFVRWERGGGAP